MGTQPFRPQHFPLLPPLNPKARPGSHCPPFTGREAQWEPQGDFAFLHRPHLTHHIISTCGRSSLPGLFSHAWLVTPGSRMGVLSPCHLPLPLCPEGSPSPRVQCAAPSSVPYTAGSLCVRCKQAPFLLKDKSEAPPELSHATGTGPGRPRGGQNKPRQPSGLRGK